MGKKRSTAEQIIGKLREIEVLVGQGDTVSIACRKAGVGEAAYYRWRREYGGLKLPQAKRLKEMEKESRWRRTAKSSGISPAASVFRVLTTR